jgi:hypothetical protein
MKRSGPARCLLCSWLATACAPVGGFRPASALLGERSAEVGAGAVVVTPRPFVEESATGAGQLWGSYRANPWLRLSAIGAFDFDAAAIGAAAAAIPLRTRYFVGGVEGELGYAWGAISLPLAAGPTEEIWVYTSPRLGTWGDSLTPFLPLGLSVEPVEAFVLRAEGQVSWEDFKYYNRRVHVGLAGAYQF